MWNIFVAIILFFVTIVLHESTHFLAGKFLGLKPKFAWIPSKEKNTVGFFGWLPGVRTKYDNIHQLKWITLSPIPVNFVGFLFVFIFLFWDYWNGVVWNWHGYLILGVTLLFVGVASYAASIHDIKDYKSRKNL